MTQESGGRIRRSTRRGASFLREIDVHEHRHRHHVPSPRPNLVARTAPSTRPASRITAYRPAERQCEAPSSPDRSTSDSLPAENRRATRRRAPDAAASGFIPPSPARRHHPLIPQRRAILQNAGFRPSSPSVSTTVQPSWPIRGRGHKVRNGVIGAVIRITLSQSRYWWRR